MRLFRHLFELGEIKRPLFMALGVFDGVHLGHQAVIREAARRARIVKGDAAVLTFHPHPAKIVRPDVAPPLLTTEQQDYELFSMLDADCCVIIDFTKKLSTSSPEEFLTHLKKSAPTLKALVVGPDWRFGHDRKGDFALLKKWCEKEDIEAIEVSPVKIEDQVVSSTAIRKFISQGDIQKANAFLGRSYQIVGRVVQGDGIGSRLGFPTANLETENELIPSSGVYAARALFEGEVRAAAVNVGKRPTVSESGEVRIEAFLINFAGDLYGHHMRLDFLSRIRDEQKFKKLEDLIRQIFEDAKKAVVEAHM
jgi:riboflavin kinase / FMN adenylyltransferase